MGPVVGIISGFAYCFEKDRCCGNYHFVDAEGCFGKAGEDGEVRESWVVESTSKPNGLFGVRYYTSGSRKEGIDHAFVQVGRCDIYFGHLREDEIAVGNLCGHYNGNGQLRARCECDKAVLILW